MNRATIRVSGAEDIPNGRALRAMAGAMAIAHCASTAFDPSARDVFLAVAYLAPLMVLAFEDIEIRVSSIVRGTNDYVLALPFFLPREPAERSQQARFAFGRNWASYATTIGDLQIAEARACLLKLIPAEELRGHSMIDIGCGSGLHTLAALQLGAGPVTAIDIDQDSVTTTRALLDRSGMSCDVRRCDVFDVAGSFDIVYSWGVLHHTGNLWRAMDHAAAMVKPGGLFAFALYRATACDAFWIREKRWYSQAWPFNQAIARVAYRAAYRLSCWARGESFASMVASYTSLRGMDFEHDLRDWLGGYPYETTLAPEVDAFLVGKGFKPVRVFALPKGRGFLGSGCDEYVYRAACART